VRAWDIAATAQTGKSRDPDWTVGTRLCTDGRRTTIEDVVRVRMSGTDVIDKIRQVAVEDGKSVPIRLPQDPGAAGKAWAQYQAAALAGFIVRTERPTGKKEVRAAAFAAQVGAGNVDMVRGPWNGALIEELRDFPHGDHDDQVDAASDAFNELHTGPSGAVSVQSLY
jgi:predicted phage terminase large subunit-like protein